LLLGLARPEIKVRLVPYLEIPLRHLVDTVPIDKMRGESRYQRVPPGIVSWRRDDGMVFERVHGLARGELARHERQLDEGANAVRQQSIVDLIEVRKVVERISAFVFVVDSDFIVQDRVESDVLEICCIFYKTQILPVTVAKRKNCPPGTEHLFPEMREAVRRSPRIDDDFFVAPGDRRHQAEKDKEEKRFHRTTVVWTLDRKKG